jgi:hypothetical protein
MNNWLIGLMVCGIFQIVMALLMGVKDIWSGFVFKVIPFFMGLFILFYVALTYFKLI